MSDTDPSSFVADSIPLRACCAPWPAICTVSRWRLARHVAGPASAGDRGERVAGSGSGRTLGMPGGADGRGSGQPAGGWAIGERRRWPGR